MSGEFNTMSLIIAELEPITLEARADGNHVRARVPTDVLREVGTQGVLQWKLVYRVVSADGHPVAGEVVFTSPLPAQPEADESLDDRTEETTSEINSLKGTSYA